jgi:alpha-galactosidase
MGIIAENNLFTLQTKNSTYQMKVDEKGILLHTYYGAKTDETDYSYLITPADRGFSGNVPMAKDERTYSLDVIPQEFPVLGSGDYRITCLKADVGSGVNDCLLVYNSHNIRAGKYQLQGLPAMFADGGESVDTLEIVLKDIACEFYIHLLYGVYEDRDVITRSVFLENRSDRDININSIMSACIDFAGNHMDMIHFHGRHANERNMERISLYHGINEIRSTRGTSSHHHNPFVIFADKNTNEDRGQCYGMMLVYSGGFTMKAEVDQCENTRVVMGLDDDDFKWTLHSGDSFTAPELCLSYSDKGLTGLSHNYHEAIMKNLIRSVWKHKRRPILVNNWEATYFDFNAEKLLKIAEEAAGLGLDMIVLDDGWFGKRDSDYTGLGDWFVNEEKLGCSLKELVDRINAMGLMFGLWFEPEMISEDSDLYREHPDWAMAIPGRDPIRARSQLVLDMTRADVIEYIKERLFTIMDSANIKYIKWDMNRSLSAAYSVKLPQDKQGEMRHRYVLGLYSVLEALLNRYPDLLLEGCSGGGGRYDAGMLYYSPQIWCSDNTDAIERLRIQYGTSFAYPMSSVSAHVSVCPNHQNGRVTPLKTRGICAMQGTFGYELDLSKMSEEEKAEVRKQVQDYKNHYSLFQYGDYYRISSPFENADFTAWEYADKDGREAYMAVVFTDNHGNALINTVKFKGLLPYNKYRLFRDDEEIGVFSGAALMNGGIVLPIPMENYYSCQYYVCVE